MTRLIISAMKNEGSFLLEWVAWHRAIGFDDFLIYTNDCEDGTVEMLERLQAMGLARHEPNDVLRRGPQKSALKTAKDHEAVARADWILVSDIDEFLNVKIGDGSVGALIAALPGADAIPVAWRLFSHDGRVGFEDRPVTEQFTDAERRLEDGGAPDRFVKTLFRRQDEVARFGTHGPITPEGLDFRWIAPDGRRLGPQDNLTRPARRFGYEAAQINHYAVCAVDSFLVKRDRGRVNHYRQTMDVDYWRRMCRGGERDFSARARLAGMKTELSRLKADPALRRLHDEAVSWRRARIAALRKRPEFEAMRAEILRLCAAGDHQRRAPPAEARAAAKRMRALLAAARFRAERLPSHEIATQTLEQLDGIENALLD